jgi:hypothetical protein
MSAESSPSPFSSVPDFAIKVGYFLAGALLPTIAYLLRNPNQSETEGDASCSEGEDDSEGEYDDSSEDELQVALGAPSTDCKKWGMRDAPYKVGF